VKDTIAAIRAALTLASLTNYFADAGTSPTLPYVLVWTGSGAPPVEDSVASRGDFEASFGVTSVAGTTEGVLIVQAAARAALASFATGSTAVAGRIVWLTLEDSRAVQVDSAVTITATGKHPAYGVDMYRLRSTPA
jgi:hypothetical protein